MIHTRDLLPINHPDLTWAGGPARWRVLIVEDDPVRLAAHAEGLTEAGVVVHAAARVDDALSLGRMLGGRSQLIVIDTTLRDADPHQLVAALRQAMGVTRCPVLFLVPEHDEGRLVECLAQPHSDALCTPTSIAVLRARVMRGLRHSQLMRERQQQAVWLRQLLDRSPDLVIVTDKHGRLIYVNHAFCDATGQPSEALIGESIAGLIHAEHGALPAPPWTGTETVHLVPAPERTFRAHFSWVEPKARQTIRGVMHDITELVQQRQRIEAMDGDVVRLQASLDGQSQLLRLISHQLRTPLASFMSELDYLAREPSMPPQARQGLAEALGAARRLRRMVDEVLTVARIKAGAEEAELGWVAVSELVRALSRPLRQRVKARRLVMELDTEPTDLVVRLDGQWLKHCLTLLLENAVNYTDSGTRVRVFARYDADRGQLVCGVEDEGPGIPAEDQACVFQPFVRLAEGQARAPGSGLGLTLARELAQAMHGELHLSSSPGFGCVFVLQVRCDVLPPEGGEGA